MTVAVRELLLDLITILHIIMHNHVCRKSFSFMQNEWKNKQWFYFRRVCVQFTVKKTKEKKRESTWTKNVPWLLSPGNQKCNGSGCFMFSHPIVLCLSALTRAHICWVRLAECKSNLYFKLDNKIIVIISI